MVHGGFATAGHEKSLSPAGQGSAAGFIKPKAMAAAFLPHRMMDRSWGRVYQVPPYRFRRRLAAPDRDALFLSHKYFHALVVIFTAKWHLFFTLFGTPPASMAWVVVPDFLPALGPDHSAT
jgi:hypothetical protein